MHNSVSLDVSLPTSTEALSGAFYYSIGQFEYLPFLAPKDDLFKRLLELRLLSPTQSACIADKSFYCAGNGLQVQDQTIPKDFDVIVNHRRQRLDDILHQGFDGYWQDGNKFIEVVRMKVGTTYQVRVYEHSNLDCRFEENKDGYDPTHVLRTREFRRAGILKKIDKAVKIPLWTDMPDPGQEVWATDPQNKNVARTMFHIKAPMSGIDGYGLPSNYAGLMQAALEYKASRFNLDNFENNMFLGGLLLISGSLSDPESKKLTREIRKMHTGDGKYNRILPLSAEGGITDSKFVPFNGKNDGQFLELDKRIEEKIIGANQWSKELMDFKNQSGLGKGGDFLVKLFKAKYHTIIKPAQEMMMNSFVWPLLGIIDEAKKTKFSALPWHIEASMPLAFDGNLDINSILTVDEGREEVGKKPFNDDRGKQFIASVAGAQKAGADGSGGQGGDQ